MGCRDLHCPKHVSSKQWAAFHDENGRKQGFPPSKVKGLTHTHGKVGEEAGLSIPLRILVKTLCGGSQRRTHLLGVSIFSLLFSASQTELAFSPLGILTGGKCSLSSSSPGQLLHFSSSLNPSFP